MHNSINGVEQKNNVHIPVMSNEVLDALNVRAGGFYIDATYGAGGHSRMILEKNAAVLAFDKDYTAFQKASALKAEFSDRFIIKHTSFSEIEKLWTQCAKPMLADGIIIDLGFSSNQIEDEDRGFSFSKNGQLDMRYDVTQDLNAKNWLNSADVEEMIRVFSNYGQEKNASKIAKAIIKDRKTRAICTTFDLVRIISKFNQYDGKNVATRIFQAIRIHVNDEFSCIKIVLEKGKKILKHYGRLAVITFHSLEDKIVKDYFSHEINFIMYPTEDEVSHNIRARSAKLRWMIKIEEDSNA